MSVLAVVVSSIPPAGHLAPASGVTLPADGGWSSRGGTHQQHPNPLQASHNPTAQPITDNRASSQSSGEIETHKQTCCLFTIYFIFSLFILCVLCPVYVPYDLAINSCLTLMRDDTPTISVCTVQLFNCTTQPLHK